MQIVQSFRRLGDRPLSGAPESCQLCLGGRPPAERHTGASKLAPARLRARRHWADTCVSPMCVGVNGGRTQRQRQGGCARQRGDARLQRGLMRIGLLGEGLRARRWGQAAQVSQMRGLMTGVCLRLLGNGWPGVRTIIYARLLIKGM